MKRMLTILIKFYSLSLKGENIIVKLFNQNIDKKNVLVTLSMKSFCKEFA